MQGGPRWKFVRVTIPRDEEISNEIRQQSPKPVSLKQDEPKENKLEGVVSHSASWESASANSSMRIASEGCEHDPRIGITAAVAIKRTAR